MTRNKIYITADLHLGHKKLQEIRKISDQDIIDRWNSVVTNDDVVYVLGDVFKTDRVKELKGIKKLALGNHDQRPVTHYLQYFSKVHSMFDYNDCLLTHIPVHESQSRRWQLNIHGHTHYNVINNLWYVCVSMEHTDFTPVLLNELINNSLKRCASSVNI